MSYMLNLTLDVQTQLSYTLRIGKTQENMRHNKDETNNIKTHLSSYNSQHHEFINLYVVI